MKNQHFRAKTGLNFKKMIRTLSNNALKYLISISNQEASYRNLKINIPNLGEDIPSISIQGNQIINIRDIEWTIKAYTTGKDWIEIANDEDAEIDPEELNWFQLYKDKTPISIKLTSRDTANEKIIEFHSRSKIFWFAKLLEIKDDSESFDTNLKWD